MGLEHTDKEYEHELRDLRETILLMAGRCEEMISKSIQALVSRDSDLARQIILLDHDVDLDEVHIDELAMLILAKRQPVASDLRLLTQSLKMSNDLERIADLAVDICERVLLLNDFPLLKPYEDIPRMAVLVQAMIKDAIDAFVEGDCEKSEQVIGRDDAVDGLYQQVIRDLLPIMTKDSEAVERGIHILAIAKFLERMGDHTVNLAEQVVFMVKGMDLRFQRRFPAKSEN